MKTLILSLVLLVSLHCKAQETKVFSLSPIAKDTEKVNGIVVGIGHYDFNRNKVINGANIDLMVLSPAIFLMGGSYGLFDKSKNDLTNDSTLTINGLNLAIAGYTNNAVNHNGLSIALYNSSGVTNGLSIIGTMNTAKTLNGFHIAGLSNNSNYLNGIGLSIYNHNDYMTGLQLGIVNRSYQIKGLQIGLFNKSNSVSGLQIGLININAKRALPFINW